MFTQRIEYYIVSSARSHAEAMENQGQLSPTTAGAIDLHLIALAEVWHHGYRSGITSAERPEWNLMIRFFMSGGGSQSAG